MYHSHPIVYHFRYTLYQCCLLMSIRDNTMYQSTLYAVPVAVGAIFNIEFDVRRDLFNGATQNDHDPDESGIRFFRRPQAATAFRWLALH